MNARPSNRVGPNADHGGAGRHEPDRARRAGGESKIAALLPEIVSSSGARGSGRRRVRARPTTGLPSSHQHPVNRALFEAAPVGARIADRVTGFMGSWRFLVVQTVIVALWLSANAILLSRPFDPFPFILLNLAFSTQAAYAAPLILLAGNRASQRDRLTLEHAAAEGDLADAQNERLLEGNTSILKQVAALEARILSLEQTILATVSGAGPVDRDA
jgi:uncharacterized membrane protein